MDQDPGAAAVEVGEQPVEGRIAQMPGSLTAAIPLEPGTVVTADFGLLGEVQARVAPTSARRA